MTEPLSDAQIAAPGVRSEGEAESSALAIAALVREHGTYVWRTLRRLGVCDSDVDDVCQDVFFTVHRKLREFENRSSLRTWLYGICVRTALAHKRLVRHKREVPTETLPEQTDPMTPHDTLTQREATELLDRALSALDDDKRAVFVLYEIEELSMSQVAEALGCPLQTAYSRLHAARDQVQSYVRRAALERGAT